MDASFAAALISASAAVIVPGASFYFTRSKERNAEWRKFKFEQYEEFLLSLSGIVGTDSTPEGNLRFAMACNTLHIACLSASTHGGPRLP